MFCVGVLLVLYLCLLVSVCLCFFVLSVCVSGCFALLFAFLFFPSCLLGAEITVCSYNILADSLGMFSDIFFAKKKLAALGDT